MPKEPKPALTAQELQEVFRLFTEEELQGFRERAALWQSGPEGVRNLEAYLQDTTLVLMQLTGAIATGQKTLVGQNGLAIWAKTVKDFPMLAERVLGILASKETA